MIQHTILNLFPYNIFSLVNIETILIEVYNYNPLMLG